VLVGTIVDHVQNRAIQIGENRYIVPAADCIATPSFGDAVFVSDIKYANCIVLRNSLGVVEMTENLYEGEPIKLFNPFDGDAEDREKLKWCRKLAEFLFHVQISSLVTGEGDLKQWKHLQSVALDHLTTFNSFAKLTTWLRLHFRNRKRNCNNIDWVRREKEGIVKMDLLRSEIIKALEQNTIDQVDSKQITSLISCNFSKYLTNPITERFYNYTKHKLADGINAILSQQPRHIWDTGILGSIDSVTERMMKDHSVQTIFETMLTDIVKDSFPFKTVRNDSLLSKVSRIVERNNQLIVKNLAETISKIEREEMRKYRVLNILTYVVETVEGTTLTALRRGKYTLGTAVPAITIGFPLNILFFKAVRTTFLFSPQRNISNDLFTLDFIARLSLINKHNVYWIPLSVPESEKFKTLGYHNQYLELWQRAPKLTNLQSTETVENYSSDDDKSKLTVKAVGDKRVRFEV
jgi:hypothetical protein